MIYKKEAVLLIHGYGFDDRIWSPVEIAFEDFHPLMYCLPGFGNSFFPGSYTIEELASHYWSEIDSLSLEKIHVVGHSMGGYVAIEMCAQKPERVLSLSLVHSHVFEDSVEKKKARTDTLDEIKLKGKEAFVRRMLSSMINDKNRFSKIIDLLIERGLKYDDDSWYNGTQAIRDRRDHSATLKSLHCPVQFIGGEADLAVPVELMYKQAALTERGLLKVYPGVGHLSMYEDPGKLITDLVTFLKNEL